jgi:transposase
MEVGMITIGVDAHKAVHVALALDQAGQPLGHWRGANSTDGWQALHQWASDFGSVRQWGIEGAWNYGRGLAQHLVAAGETVYEVNPRWTALGRRSARRPGKTDRLDAQAVALLVLREGAHLPVVTAEDETAVLDLMVTEREGALSEATRLRGQIHSLLLQLDPGYKTTVPTLTSARGLAAVLAYENSETALKHQRAAAVRRTAQRLKLALEQAEELAAQIGAHAVTAGLLPLTQLCGVNLLTAAALAGILGPGQRFASDAGLAAYAGAAPIEASSADRVRHRLNRGGNRRLNAILYRIALTQARHAPEAQAYLARRRSEGKTTREAFRALKRFLVRHIWRLWQECLPAATVAISDKREARSD